MVALGQLTVVSAHRTPERMVEFARLACQRGIQVIIAGAGGAAHLPGGHPKRLIAINSRSRFLYCHKTSDKLRANFSPDFGYRIGYLDLNSGFRVLGFGVPGMVAALTPLPVIGVPVRATHLEGVDSLLSILQVPLPSGLCL